MTKDEALKMAIEAFDNIDMSNQTNEECARAWFIEGYVQALEWPAKGIELEWYNKGWTDAIWEFEWLSDNEIDKLYADWEEGQTDYSNYARAIEQALKEKNHD